jgi:cellobiose-specific phosphotransferase system component IIC
MVSGIQQGESDVCKPILSCESIAVLVAVESGIIKIIPVIMENSFSVFFSYIKVYFTNAFDLFTNDLVSQYKLP